MRRLSNVSLDDKDSVAAASPGLRVGEPVSDSAFTALMKPSQTVYNSTIMNNMKQEIDESSRPDIISGFSEVSLKAYTEVEAFKLIDEDENLMVNDKKELMNKLGCSGENDLQVKVVCIFGNTGEGKSHFLNCVFFNKQKVFKTSNSQTSCTMGVWAALSREHKAIVLDTEGMLGISSNADRRKRMLLKVLAISDIVIYRTRAERLHTDMYKFLAEASRAYTKFFKDDLNKVSRRTNTNASFGPPVFIFHDTKNTEVLITDEYGVSPEQHIQEAFTKLGYSIDGFSSIHYVGENGYGNKDTVFSRISAKLFQQIKDTQVRTSRSPGIVLEMLKTINKKFSGQIIQNDTMFPDEYFTCTSYCRACNVRCSLFMNHMQHSDRVQEHVSKTNCCYKAKLDNKIYLCLACDKRGVRNVVFPQTVSQQDNTWFGLAKYAWSGHILECEDCGIIYRSRQYWYGNSDPDNTTVKIEFVHVWPGSVIGNSPNAGRHVIDGVTAIGSALSSVSSQPSRAISMWLSDKVVNPTYWKPNSECINCDRCKLKLNSIHHCRKCGLGFCDNCSTNVQLVPERGWGRTPVRVCDGCYSSRLEYQFHEGHQQDVAVRQVSEVIKGTLSTVVNYPIDILKDSTRPQYWIPDEDITECLVCHEKFGPTLSLHHCRACGEGVCEDCSSKRMIVKERGWNSEVRVCDLCYERRNNANLIK